MVNPSAKGARSEAAILHALVASGRTVLMPWGGSQRYDFVIDEGNGQFTRVQCKTGVFRDGAVYFRTASADRRRPMGDSYIGQIDAFAVHCPELRASFLVPIDAVSATQRAALRVRAAISNQASGIRWAAHYVVDPGTAVFFTPGQGEQDRKAISTPSLSALPSIASVTG